ncbi:hypothetical protein MIND_00166400 [Mycena indigotica]|uniref:Uncharacterized protein n=1 Tax=Mycena indigotica TaxID=2126181 RepID=A0A8H6WIT8_9AGAR|nr:uncharacterized protein MIND_00166400 [Mycena indigotica]KAF7316473.1 hypothetical protein MIND_00166400 [Mycena indigotica]
MDSDILDIPPGSLRVLRRLDICGGLEEVERMDLYKRLKGKPCTLAYFRKEIERDNPRTFAEIAQFARLATQASDFFSVESYYEGEKIYRVISLPVEDIPNTVFQRVQTTVHKVPVPQM